MVKEYKKTEFEVEYKKKYPLRAKIITGITMFVSVVIYITILFLTVTVTYSVLRWAIGVWV